jgi:hypothetical protein
MFYRCLCWFDLPVQAILQDHFDVPSRTACSALSTFESCSDWLSLNVELFLNKCAKQFHVDWREKGPCKQIQVLFLFLLCFICQTLFWTPKNWLFRSVDKPIVYVFWKRNFVRTRKQERRKKKKEKKLHWLQI